MARGQRLKQAKLIPRIGVDEKAFCKGHNYMTVVCDLDAASVEYVAEDRTTERLEGYWKYLSQAQLEGIESVSMDMWPAYIGATLSQVPGALSRIGSTDSRAGLSLQFHAFAFGQFHHALHRHYETNDLLRYMSLVP